VLREAVLIIEELLDSELDIERLEGVKLDATAELMATDDTTTGLGLLPPPPPPPPQPTNSSTLPRITP